MTDRVPENNGGISNELKLSGLVDLGFPTVSELRRDLSFLVADARLDKVLAEKLSKLVTDEVPVGALECIEKILKALKGKVVEKDTPTLQGGLRTLGLYCSLVILTESDFALAEELASTSEAEALNDGTMIPYMKSFYEVSFIPRMSCLATICSSYIQKTGTFSEKKLLEGVFHPLGFAFSGNRGDRGLEESAGREFTAFAQELVKKIASYEELGDAENDSFNRLTLVVDGNLSKDELAKAVWNMLCEIKEKGQRVSIGFVEKLLSAFPRDAEVGWNFGKKEHESESSSFDPNSEIHKEMMDRGLGKWGSGETFVPVQIPMLFRALSLMKGTEDRARLNRLYDNAVGFLCESPNWIRYYKAAFQADLIRLLRMKIEDRVLSFSKHPDT